MYNDRETFLLLLKITFSRNNLAINEFVCEQSIIRRSGIQNDRKFHPSSDVLIPRILKITHYITIRYKCENMDGWFVTTISRSHLDDIVKTSTYRLHLF